MPLVDAYTGTTQPSMTDQELILFRKMAASLYAIQQNGSGGGSTPTPTPDPSYSPTTVYVEELSAGAIPIGADSWSFTALNGTVTFDGKPAPAGLTIRGQKTSRSISYATDSLSTAYVIYENKV